MKQLSTSRVTLGVQAYKAIREEIVSMRLKPGELIYEKEMAGALGISRTPLREAFHMLLQEELIIVMPNRGAQVAYMSEQKVMEAQFVRESLETSAFAKVAGMWDAQKSLYIEAEIQILRVIEEQKTASQTNNTMLFIQRDEDFHHHILELANNRTLVSIVQQMKAHLNRFRYLELQAAHHEHDAILHHEQIFQAIRLNDVPATEKLLLQHLRHLEKDRIAIINKYSEFFN